MHLLLNTLCLNHSATATFADTILYFWFINGFLSLIRPLVGIVKIIHVYLEDSMSALLEV